MNAAALAGVATICRSCGQVTLRVTTELGRPCLVDPVPRPSGSMRVDDRGTGRYLMPAERSGDLYGLHWRTCGQSPTGLDGGG